MKMPTKTVPVMSLMGWRNQISDAALLMSQRGKRSIDDGDLMTAADFHALEFLLRQIEHQIQGAITDGTIRTCTADNDSCDSLRNQSDGGSCKTTRD
jgi:hypothetical protein